jgi:hypothetical protein
MKPLANLPCTAQIGDALFGLARWWNKAYSGQQSYFYLVGANWQYWFFQVRVDVRSGCCPARPSLVALRVSSWR